MKRCFPAPMRPAPANPFYFCPDITTPDLEKTQIMNKQHIIGYIMIFTAALLFSLIGPISLFAMKEGVTPLEAAFWRATFGALSFGLHGLLIGAWRIPRQQRLHLSLFGVPGVGLLFFCFIYGVNHAGAAMTSVLNNTAPLWVAVWAWLFLNEALTGSKIFSIILAVVGAGIISASGGGLSAGATVLGIVAAAASGFLFSLHSLIAKKFLTENASAVSIYMYILPVGALSMLPFVEFMPDKSWVAWASLISMGLVCNWVPYLCFCGALKRLPATRVSVLETSSEPFLAAMFAFLWWGEAFTPMGWLGVFLVIGAVVMVILSKDRQRRPLQSC